ncbi:hypothetical protein PSCICE_39110 [Pseudomonas cichorii]|nr:hypothetical protein PSCICE_39110 [Pseudomonas cichorii]
MKDGESQRRSEDCTHETPVDNATGQLQRVQLAGFFWPKERACPGPWAKKSHSTEWLEGKFGEKSAMAQSPEKNPKQAVGPLFARLPVIMAN